MRTFEQWMTEYGVSHKNPVNKLIHKFCVPLIMFSILGLMWLIPKPTLMGQLELINWSTLFSILVILFYFSLSIKYALILICVFFGMQLLNYQIFDTSYFLNLQIIIFVISWVFQFIGHKIEGKKPSFLEDLSFLLIGPLWVVKNIFNLK